MLKSAQLFMPWHTLRMRNAKLADNGKHEQLMFIIDKAAQAERRSRS